MSHRDQCVRLNVVCLRQCLRWLLAGIDWSSISLRADCFWTSRALASAALLWAWSDEPTLVERFYTVRKIIGYLDNRQQQLAGSYQAFIKLLGRWTEHLSRLIATALQVRMEQSLAENWRIGNRLVFGVDGSRIDLPRTRSHEQAYSASRHKRVTNRRRKKLSAAGRKKVNSPQLWLTTLWHAGTGLPWQLRLGPSNSSERAHLHDMLEGLPVRSLLAADAGFVGYDTLQAILDHDADFLIRVGANVRLLKKLGWAREQPGTVYLWPDLHAKAGRPPLMLRLVVAHNGKHPVYLVTNILSPCELTDQQLLKIYAKRWGIEVFYRHFKQTYNRRKLRSMSAANALLEAEWSLLGLWAMGLYALLAATAAGVSPAKISFARLLLAFRRTMRDYRHQTESNDRLCERLRIAVIDDYHRKNKASRDYPRQNHNNRPAGKPLITNATPSQIQTARSLKYEMKKRLTA